jgi:hypothetical protein
MLERAGYSVDERLAALDRFDNAKHGELTQSSSSAS